MKKYNDFNVFSDTVNAGSQGVLNVLVYLPGGKVDGVKPAFWFFNGLRESTGPVSQLMKWGPLPFVNEKWQPDFTIVAVQNLTWKAQANIDSVFDTLKLRYGIGAIVTTGLSEGGYGVMKEMAAYPTTSFSKATKAIIPMSTAEGQHPDGVKGIIESGIGAWFFGDDPGDIHGIFTHRDYIDLVAQNPTGPYIWTRTTQGHGGWDKQYNPAYKGANGLSIYDWGLQFVNGEIIPPIEPPVKTLISTTVVTVKAYSDGTTEIL